MASAVEVATAVVRAQTNTTLDFGRTASSAVVIVIVIVIQKHQWRETPYKGHPSLGEFGLAKLDTTPRSLHQQTNLHHTHTKHTYIRQE